MISFRISIPHTCRHRYAKFLWFIWNWVRITGASVDVTYKYSCSDGLKYTGDIVHIAHSCIMYICPCSSIQNLECLDMRWCRDLHFVHCVVLYHCCSVFNLCWLNSYFCMFHQDTMIKLPLRHSICYDHVRDLHDKH